MSRATRLWLLSLLLWQWVWLFGLAAYPLALPLLASLPLLGIAIALRRAGARALMPGALLGLLYFAFGVMEAYASNRSSFGPWGEIVLSLAFCVSAAREIRGKTAL